jgi:hypothetical protein
MWYNFGTTYNTITTTWNMKGTYYNISKIHTVHTTTTKKFYKKERSGSGMGIGGFGIGKKNFMEPNQQMSFM